MEPQPAMGLRRAQASLRLAGLGTQGVMWTKRVVHNRSALHGLRLGGGGEMHEADSPAKSCLGRGSAC